MIVKEQGYEAQLRLGPSLHEQVVRLETEMKLKKMEDRLHKREKRERSLQEHGVFVCVEFCYEPGPHRYYLAIWRPYCQCAPRSPCKMLVILFFLKLIQSRSGHLILLRLNSCTVKHPLYCRTTTYPGTNEEHLLEYIKT